LAKIIVFLNLNILKIQDFVYELPIGKLVIKKNKKSTEIQKCQEMSSYSFWKKISFINVIGNRLIAESGDSKSKKFLFEKISLAIQRGNAASIRGTFADSSLSEIFVL
jgi:hypothetical protein